jgi:hypothetical protein
VSFRVGPASGTTFVSRGEGLLDHALWHEHDRAGRLARDARRDASEQRRAHGAPPSGADNDEVGALPARLLEDAIGRVAGDDAALGRGGDPGDGDPAASIEAIGQVRMTGGRL